MSISKDNPIKKTALFLALINVLAFLVYYTVFYVWKNQPTLYVFYYFTEIVNILLPILAATALFISYAKHGVNRSLLYLLYFSLTWILHLVPYYAYEYAYQRLDFEAVLAFAALHTVFMIIVDTLARSISAAEIPVSILTAIIGAPVFIILMRRSGGWQL